jgi:hypothetical protein
VPVFCNTSRASASILAAVAESITLAKSLTAPRGEGYFSAANDALVSRVINIAVHRDSIILPLLPRGLIISFFTTYQKII